MFVLILFLKPTELSIDCDCVFVFFQRHCRLVHKSDSFVERYSTYSQAYQPLMPSVSRFKEGPSMQMQLEHEQ